MKTKEREFEFPVGLFHNNTPDKFIEISWGEKKFIAKLIRIDEFKAIYIRREITKENPTPFKE